MTFHYGACDLTSWMGLIPDDEPLSHVLLPGTHDSGAYKMDWQKGITHESEQDTFKKNFGFVSAAIDWLPNVRDVVHRWSVCQFHDIYGQLFRGVRYFDLRISFHSDSGEFMVSHTFTCAPLKTILADFERFLTERPSEVVVITCKHDYAHKKLMNFERCKQLVETVVASGLGKFLVPRTGDLTQPPSHQLTPNHTLGNLRKANHRCFFTYNEFNHQIWPAFPTVWHRNSFEPEDSWDNVNKCAAKRDCIKNRLGNRKFDCRVKERQIRDKEEKLNEPCCDQPCHEFRSLDLCLTPKGEDIKEDTIGRYKWLSNHSLQSWAHLVNSQFLVDFHHSSEKRERLRTAYNAVTTDYADSTWCEFIVSLNFPPKCSFYPPDGQIDICCPAIFDARFYLQHHKDLAQAFGSDVNQARNHWLGAGVNEGRVASASWHVKTYKSNYKDLSNMDPKTACEHFLRSGANEDRLGDPNSPIANGVQQSLTESVAALKFW